MTVIHATTGSAVLLLSLIAGIWGVWCWWQARPSKFFWQVLRASQAAVVAQVLLGGVLIALAHKPAELHMLYGLLPLVVSFIAEQLRVASADMVLSSRDLDSSARVRALPETDQNVLVLAIMRREIGVMAVSALVVFALALRAAQSAGLF